MRTCLITLFTFTVLTAFLAAVSMADLTDGLVAYWPMDEGSGETAADASGNDHDGVLMGGATWETAEPKFGAACVNFDGEDDLVEIGAFDVEGGGITLAAWIRPDDFDINDARVISKANEWGSNDHWWMLSTIDSTNIRFRLKTNDGQDVPTLIAEGAGLEAGVWMHVAATWDGAMMRLYKNAEEVGSLEKGGTEVATDAAVKVAIGSQPSDAFATDPTHVEKFFDGLIDDVVVYNRALSADELQQLMDSSVPVATAVSVVEKLVTTWAHLKQ